MCEEIRFILFRAKRRSDDAERCQSGLSPYDGQTLTGKDLPGAPQVGCGSTVSRSRYKNITIKELQIRRDVRVV